MRGHARTAAVSVAAAVAGLLCGAIIISATGASPLAAANSVLYAGFSCGPEYCGLNNTLALFPPLACCAVAGVIVLRSGMFSIGQEGQYALGGLAAAWTGYALELPAGLHAVVAMAAAVAAGAAWAYIPALLKVRLGVNELICSIIFNNIAVLLLGYLISYPMRADASSQPYTPRIHDTAMLPVFDTASKVGVALLIALAVVAAAWFYLSRTTAGYEQRMSGDAPAFARYSGMRTERGAVRAMLVSGGIAGLGGALQVLGVNYRVVDGFADGTGFNGLTAALLGGLTTIGAALAAFAFAGITTGALNGLQIELGIPNELGTTVFGFTILFVALRAPLIKWWTGLRRHRPDSRPAAAESPTVTAARPVPEGADT